MDESIKAAMKTSVEREAAATQACYERHRAGDCFYGIPRDTSAGWVYVCQHTDTNQKADCAERFKDCPLYKEER